MQQDLKQQIAIGLAEYAKVNNLSGNDISRLTGVNTGYISNILRSQFAVEVGGKVVPIGDKHFVKLADLATVAIKKNYWRTFATRQFMEGISALEDAKSSGRTAMIIGSTGNGKTNFIDTFCNKMPLHTYRITVSSLYNLQDIITELAERLGVDFNNGIKQTRKGKIDMICDKLTTISHNGGNPIVIFDEAENLKMPVINMLKGLYDTINKHCAIVLIGTSQLLVKLTHQRKNSLDALPQFYRRFKVGLKKLSPLEKHIDFKPFFEAYVPDKSLQKLLINLCDNYGELNDYLEPAMRLADQKGQPLNETFFRLMYNLPNY